MKLGRDVSCHNELDNGRNTHIYESIVATIWLLLTISKTDPGLWDRLLGRLISALLSRAPRLGLPFTKQGGSVPPRRDGKYQGLKQPRRPGGRDLSLHPSGE